MKTFIKLLLIMAITPLSTVLAADYTISGKLITKITETISSPGASGTDCNGNTVSLPASSVTNTRLSPASFTTATIKVYKGDSTGSLVATYPSLSKATINWNNNPSVVTDSGKFSYTLTGLSYSRFNYRAYVYLDGASSSVYSEEFMLNKVPGIPIGTIWAYMGDGDDLDALAVGGWYLCRGQAISTLSELTSDEKTVLQNLFTNSNKPNPTNLPDLRGMFLRGADEGSGNDPDRTARTGGDNVGSTQGENVGVHGHTGSTSGAGGHDHGGWTGGVGNHSHGGSTNSTSISFSAQADETVSNSADNNAIVNGVDDETSRSHSHGISPDGAHSHSIPSVGDHTHTVTINNSTGSETRPKNVYVNYIIKCR